MQRAAVVGSKAVIVAILTISLAGQTLVIPLVADETVRMYPEAAYLRLPGIVGCVAIVACAQVALVCVWRLLSMVARESIFQPSAFRLVSTIIGSAFAATLLFVAAFAILLIADAASPGVMIMILTGAVTGAGLTLLLVVMRGLLKKATELEQDLAEVV